MPNEPTPTEASTANIDRVVQAEQNVGAALDELLASKQLDSLEIEIYLRAFKEEDELEIWAKNRNDESFQLLQTYAICEKSGKIGPKRKQGDYQVPEGYYHIDRFNPKSRFHLSLGVDYPNASDRILGNQAKLGGDIFIHGDCVTIGCLPMTNAKMEEIYILASWAKDAEQTTIPVTVFPCRMNEDNWIKLQKEHTDNKEFLGLWKDLKDGYDFFEGNKKLPRVGFLDDGRHSVSEGR